MEKIEDNQFFQGTFAKLGYDRDRPEQIKSIYDTLLLVVWNVDPTYSKRREVISDCSNVHNFTMRCYLKIGSSKHF